MQCIYAQRVNITDYIINKLIEVSMEFAILWKIHGF